MGTFVQRDSNADSHNMETVAGDAGGEIAKVALKSAIEAAIESAASALTAITGYLDGVEGYVDGIEGAVDGLETLVTATNTALTTLQGLVDGVEGYVDGLETLVGATNTALTTLQGYLDGVEGKLDTLHADLLTLQPYLDGVEGKLDTLHTDLGTTLAGYLSTLAGTVTSTRVQTDVVTLPAPNSNGPYYTQSTVNTGASQLASQALKHGLWVRNLDSTKSLAVGNDSSVTTSNAYVLRPGEEKFVPVANRNQVWLAGSASSTSYCTLGT